MDISYKKVSSAEELAMDHGAKTLNWAWRIAQWFLLLTFLVYVGSNVMSPENEVVVESGAPPPVVTIEDAGGKSDDPFEDYDTYDEYEKKVEYEQEDYGDEKETDDYYTDEKKNEVSATKLRRKKSSPASSASSGKKTSTSTSSSAKKGSGVTSSSSQTATSSTTGSATPGSQDQTLLETYVKTGDYYYLNSGSWEFSQTGVDVNMLNRCIERHIKERVWHLKPTLEDQQEFPLMNQFWKEEHDSPGVIKVSSRLAVTNVPNAQFHKGSVFQEAITSVYETPNKSSWILGSGDHLNVAFVADPIDRFIDAFAAKEIYPYATKKMEEKLVKKELRKKFLKVAESYTTRKRKRVQPSSTSQAPHHHSWNIFYKPQMAYLYQAATLAFGERKANDTNAKGEMENHLFDFVGRADEPHFQADWQYIVNKAGKSSNASFETLFGTDFTYRQQILHDRLGFYASAKSMPDQLVRKFCATFYAEYVCFGIPFPPQCTDKQGHYNLPDVDFPRLIE